MAETDPSEPAADWTAEFARPLLPPAGHDLAVFAYGSLMWRPGFAHLGHQPARLHGWHRSFCIYSHHYRGTRERPGLVLGLDRGGSCRGLVFHVAAADAAHTLAYLIAREMVTQVYRPIVAPVSVAGRRLLACTFVVDRAHEQYAGRLPPEAAARLIARAAGRNGANRDYLASTVDRLEELGLPDTGLRRLHRLVAGQGQPQRE